MHAELRDFLKLLANRLLKEENVPLCQEKHISTNKFKELKIFSPGDRCKSFIQELRNDLVCPLGFTKLHGIYKNFSR